MHGVGVRLVRDALLVEDVFPRVTRPEVVETVPEQIPEVIKRVSVPVVLAVVVLLVEVGRVLGHPMVVVHAPALRVREQLVSFGQLHELVLGIPWLSYMRLRS